MKVLLTSLWPVGGIRTFFRYIYGQDAFSDIELHLVAPDRGLGGYLEKHLPPDRITLHPCDHHGRVFAGAVRRHLRAQRYALIHSHGFSAGAITALAALGRDTPHMMTAHDVFLPTSFPGLKGKLRRRSLSLLYRRLNLIHAVTMDGADNLLEYLPELRPERVKPILHGIDTQLFSQAKPVNIRAELDLPENALLVGFFGRFMAQKGFRTLVDAVDVIRREQLTTRPLRVLTFGWGGFIREDYQYLTEKGLAEHFIQLEATDEPQRWMKGMDVVAMPSRWEACGLLGMEALCAGVPIVGTTCIGLREVLEGSPAPMVEPEDAAALARALMKAAQADQRPAFEAYQATAAQRFAIERPARDLRALYESLT